MKTDVVCNTGPLVALGLISRLELLRELFARVYIPKAVASELLADGPSAPGVRSF